MNGELNMSDKLKEQRVREICNSAVNACSHFYTDLSLGAKHLALKILEELDAKDDRVNGK
jgi:hypothetical protein